MYHTLHLHRAAPAKPSMGAPCNGCGVCCAIEPCPLGALVTRRLEGACSALRWLPEQRTYRCGLVERPGEHLAPALRWAAPMLAAVAHRYISAGSGCDCGVTVEDECASA